jgi:putative salt-induced outer membrane protein
MAWAQVPVTEHVIVPPAEPELLPPELPLTVIADERPVPVVNQLPEPVRELLLAAMRENDDAAVQAIARAAGSTYPGAQPDLDRLLSQWGNETKSRGDILLSLADLPIAIPITRLREVETDPINPRFVSGRGELGGFRSTGSTSEFGVSGALTINYRIGRWQHVLRGAIDYRRSNGKTSQENWLLAHEPRLQLSPDMFIYGLTQYEHAPFVGYHSRYTVSSGLGAVLIKQSGLNLRVTSGPAFRMVDYVLGNNESRLGLRSAVDFDWRLSPTLKFTQTANSYLESDVVTLNMNSGVTAQIAARLASRFSYNVQLEHTGEPGDVRYLRRLDTISRVSLVYEF